MNGILEKNIARSSGVRFGAVWFVCATILSVVAGVRGDEIPTAAEKPPALATDAAALPRTVEVLGLHNVFQATPRLWTGSSPSNDAHFAALAKLGIRTIISVDGARPTVAVAARHGIRYVHLPVGYHGVERARVAELTRAARDLPGSVYLHCHHGKHRGPAAAAAVCVTLGQWTPSQATKWMQTAGTSPEYRGLYDTLTSDRLPSAAQIDQVPLDLPAIAEPESAVEAMVRIDELWDRLQAALKPIAAQQSQVAAADERRETAVATALLLAEQFREWERVETLGQRPAPFTALLTATRQAVETLHDSLQKQRETAPLVKQIGANCKACHRDFRDQR